MFLSRLAELSELVQQCIYTDAERRIDPSEALDRAKKVLLQTKERGGAVYVVGNGGSAGIASHFSADLLKTLRISSHTLVDSNVLTCFGNDCGYENVFSLPLSTLMKDSDTLVAISSSGRSPNIINAAHIAREKGAALITLSGFAEGNLLRQMGDLNFWLGRSDYGLVEAGHFFLLHTIIDALQLDFVHSAEASFARF